MPAKKSPAGTPAAPSNETRLTRTISFPPYQDRWLEETLGERGNVSALMQYLVGLVMDGKVDLKEAILGSQKGETALERAAKYQRAKEASMSFEEDVAAVLIKWIRGRKLRLTRGRVHNGHGTTFVADFSIEKESGEVVCSVNCKSSSRPDRLQLALAEAMIGNGKTGKPVITVVPYFVEESSQVAEQFKLVGYVLSDLKGCAAGLDRVTR